MGTSAKDLLRERGLRVTASRIAVLDSVERLGGHVDAATVAREARAVLGSVSTQAVYDVLNALTDAELLRRIEPAGSPARYEARVGDNHHHLVCRRCGLAVDVDCVVGQAPCLAPDASQGFAVPLTVPPNVDYAERFVALSADARAHERGLWAPGACS